MSGFEKGQNARRANSSDRDAHPVRCNDKEFRTTQILNFYDDAHTTKKRAGKIAVQFLIVLDLVFAFNLFTGSAQLNFTPLLAVSEEYTDNLFNAG